MKPLSLYIHIPYCLEKCPYCDFHSIATPKEEVPHQDYAEQLVAQMHFEVERMRLQQHPLLSIFFGGGTPSLMNPGFFETVLSEANRHFAFEKNIEITVETNPATATRADFKKWIGLGTNRVSFGVQSFQNPLLKKLGRNHSSQEARKAIHAALDAGFSNVSLDLIFGIEGQTMQALEKDLQEALSFNLPHVSAYQLTVEAGTPLAAWVNQGRFQIPPEEKLIAMHNKVAESFEMAGLKRYEVSNYAKPGFESRHNLQYWRYGDYLGIGSGAVSSVQGKRWRTTRKLKEYMDGNLQHEEEEVIDSKTALKEKWMMGLRLSEGVSLDFAEDSWRPKLLEWEQDGLLHQIEGKIKVTPKGILVLNQITQNVFDLVDRMW